MLVMLVNKIQNIINFRTHFSCYLKKKRRLLF
ncbi:hypothetical protein [Staphylococcus phage vB_SauP-V4SA02]|nr:hypothetical protein [Staphylococcus phage vB_SauP-V4SA02]